MVATLMPDLSLLLRSEGLAGVMVEGQLSARQMRPSQPEEEEEVMLLPLSPRRAEVVVAAAEEEKQTPSVPSLLLVQAAVLSAPLTLMSRSTLLDSRPADVMMLTQAAPVHWDGHAVPE